MTFTARLRRITVWTVLAAGCLLVDVLLVRDSGALLKRLLASASPFRVIAILGAAVLLARMAVFIYSGIRGAQEESRHKVPNLLGPWPGV